MALLTGGFWTIIALAAASVNDGELSAISRQPSAFSKVMGVAGEIPLGPPLRKGEAWRIAFKKIGRPLTADR